MQPPPPSPLEELEAKVSQLESRQMQLSRTRAELQEDFADLEREQERLKALRDEVLEAQQEAAERAAAMREVEAEALAEEKPPPPEEPLAVVPPTPGGPGLKPYAVHTSSFRNESLAFKEADRLEAKGYEAYVSRADLGAGGRWMRVLIGRFPSADEARSYASSFKAKEGVSYAGPLRLPYSVALEGYRSAREARRALKELEAEGLHPYLVEEGGSGDSRLYRLMVGAYATRAEAERAADKAASAGASAAVVTP